jgi:hypothetical protein
MDITYVIGIGPNQVKIPLLAFTSEQDAHDLLRSMGLVIDNWGGYSKIMTPEGEEDLYLVLGEDNEQAERVRQALFKDGHYYGGCGECDRLKIVTVPVGVPVVGWNLD